MEMAMEWMKIAKELQKLEENIQSDSVPTLNDRRSWFISPSDEEWNPIVCRCKPRIQHSINENNKISFEIII
jgi:hypothetical protein